MHRKLRPAFDEALADELLELVGLDAELTKPMKYTRSLSWGITLAVLATVAGIVVAFATSADLAVPGLLEIESQQRDGKPETEFMFNPLVSSCRRSCSAPSSGSRAA
jgi:hypothetical protein